MSMNGFDVVLLFIFLYGALCIEVFFLSAHIHGYGGGHIEVSIFFSCQNYVTASSVYYAIYIRAT